MATITRTLEPGITYFSAAEIRVVRGTFIILIESFLGALKCASFYHFTISDLQVLLPIGDIPDDVFQHYASLVMAHRQVHMHQIAQKNENTQIFSPPPPLRFFFFFFCSHRSNSAMSVPFTKNLKRAPSNSSHGKQATCTSAFFQNPSPRQHRHFLPCTTTAASSASSA